MTVRTIQGVVRDGVVEFSERLDAPEGTRVTVQVPAATGNHRPITRGMFRKRDGSGLSDQDAKDIKRILDREWERSWGRLERQ